MRSLFGARAQIIVGSACFVVGVLLWVYGATLHGEALLKFVYHVSMFFGLVACWSIVSNGLSFRKTEHVETKVANIGHADEIEVKD